MSDSERVVLRKRPAFYVALVAVLTLLAAAAIAGGTVPSARAGAFNCESRGDGKTCSSVSGPNEGMQEGEGANYSYGEFELVFWKYETLGYKELYRHLFYSYTGIHCYASYFNGHIQVNAAAKDNLAGNQFNGCRS